jgi:hypothetical protein
VDATKTTTATRRSSNPDDRHPTPGPCQATPAPLRARQRVPASASCSECPRSRRPRGEPPRCSSGTGRNARLQTRSGSAPAPRQPRDAQTRSRTVEVEQAMKMSAFEPRTSPTRPSRRRATPVDLSLLPERVAGTSAPPKHREAPPLSETPGRRDRNGAFASQSDRPPPTLGPRAGEPFGLGSSARSPAQRNSYAPRGFRFPCWRRVSRRSRNLPVCFAPARTGRCAGYPAAVGVARRR